MQEQTELKRSMGIWSGLALVIGTVIGSGIFFKQAGVLQDAGSSTMALLAWLTGGVITLAAALSIAEVGARLPKTGGLYSYIESLYGPTAGFLTGWMQVIVYAPAVIAAIAGYAAFLTANFLGLAPRDASWIAVIYILFVVTINLLENRVAAGFQVLTTSIKLIPIAVLIGYGLFFGKVDALGQTVHQVATAQNGGFGVAILATLFAYDGWILLANIAGEMKNPRRDLPRSLIFGVSIVVFAYVGVTYGVFHALPVEQIVKLQNNATFAVAQTAFGDFGGRALSLGIIISMLGTLNGKMLAFPRMAYAMAQDGLFPKYLSKLTKKTQVPTNAIASVGMLAILLAIFYTDGVDRLSDLAIFAIWIFYTAAFFGVFILRRKAKIDGTDKLDTLFKSPLYPLMPLVAIFGAIFVLYSTIVSDIYGVSISLIMVLLGLPVFFYYRKKNNVLR